MRLVRETLPQAPTPLVETLAVMATYNPFFQHAGMKLIEAPNVKVPFMQKLEALGFDLQLMGSSKYNLKVLKKLRTGKRELVKSIILKELIQEKFRRDLKLEKAVKGNDLGAMAELLKRYPLPSVCLTWRDPKTDLPDAIALSQA